MRINHNISSMMGQQALAGQHEAMAKSIEKLSTGLRINRASDDAAGLSVSEQLRSQVRGMDRAKSNASDGIALLQIAEGAANQISSVLQRMRELAVQSSNDTLTTTERTYTNSEFQDLMSEIERISVATQYNGQTLLDGGATSFGATGSASSILHIGANNNHGDAAGTIDTINVSIDALTLGAIGMTQTTTSISTHSAAFTAISTIDNAINSVNQMRSDMGTYINRLDYAINNLNNQAANTQDAESRIRDVDFASETTQFTKSQILTQSATSMLAQANQVPQGVLSLLQ
jgi:flagellin